MAYTSLANIIEPKTFAQYVAEAVSVKSALIQSGAVLQSDALNLFAGQGGTVVDLPHFNQFTWSAPAIAKDTNDAATINAVTAGKQIAQKDYLSETWGVAALTAAVSGADVVGHIVNNVVAPYWAQTLQNYALAKISGVIKDNIADDSSDMVFSVTNVDANSAVAAGDKANIDNVLEAIQTMGDARDKVKVIAMHSRVFSNLMKLEPTNFSPQSSTQPFNQYMGMTVLIDDSLPVTAGTYRTIYTTYLLGEGALLLGEAEPAMGAVEVERNALHGNGFGAETLTSRKQLILHPSGTASTATVTSAFGSPTIAQYDNAGAFDRVVSRKNVPIIALRTNG